jgi:nucleoside-diphosphate-sugar epimerase
LGLLATGREGQVASTVGVLGASGVYGRHLVPRLAARGWRVRALVRRPEAAAALAASGAEISRADIFEPATLREGLAGCDVAVNLATDLPMPGEAADFAANDRLRREGVPLWLGACREAGVERVLQQSIGLVHAGTGDAWVDEDAFVPPDRETVTGRAIAAALDMEAAVRGSGLDWLILRGAYFYGPGTGVEDDWFARAREGRLRLPGDGADYLSLVHVADMAAATVLAIERWPSRQALIVADDAPARTRDILADAARLAGGAPPQPGGRGFGVSFRLRNARARERLGWAPAYPDHRAGLAR